MYIHPLLLVCEMLLCIHNNLLLYHEQANAHIIVMWCCHSSYNIWYWCLDGPTSLSNYLDCKQRGVTGAKRGAIKWAINRDVTLGEGIKKLCHASIRLKSRQHTDRQDAPISDIYIYPTFKKPSPLKNSLNPFTPKSDLIDFTLSNARRFYSSKGDPLGVKGLKQLFYLSKISFPLSFGTCKHKVFLAGIWKKMKKYSSVYVQCLS